MWIHSICWQISKDSDNQICQNVYTLVKQHRDIHLNFTLLTSPCRFSEQLSDHIGYFVWLSICYILNMDKGISVFPKIWNRGHPGIWTAHVHRGFWMTSALVKCGYKQILTCKYFQSQSPTWMYAWATKYIDRFILDSLGNEVHW